MQVLAELPEKVRRKVPIELDPAHKPALEAVKADMAALEAGGWRWRERPCVGFARLHCKALPCPLQTFCCLPANCRLQTLLLPCMLWGTWVH